MANRTGKKRANLRDVAEAAGVSVATVSRVLNSPAVVSEETRERVRNAIDQLHFVPSAAARAINSGRTRIVGALVPTLDNAIFSKFLAGLEARFGQNDLSLVVATTDEDPDIEAEKAAELIDIGAEGLIVSGITHSEAFDALVRRTRLPTIATSFYDESYHFPTIGYDNVASSRLALNYLRSAGHQNIAVLHGPAKNNDRTRARLQGLKTEDPALSIKPFETEISMQGAANSIGIVLESGFPFTAVLSLSDVLAMGAMFELQRRGYKLPDDISIMGVDDLPSSAFTLPAISTVHLPVSRMGEQTADAMVQWIEEQQVPKSILLDSQLIIRQSTRDINGALL